VTGLPYHFSAAQPEIRRRAPRRGEHNADVLADWLGLDQAAVDGLAALGVLLAS
jgi:crotonobetainyl-CoA:carnitine CoA-transferase CaiB-like acyl-CoA transferase